MHVAVMLPVYGRPDQTMRNAARLKAAAGMEAAWWAIGGPDERGTLQALAEAGWLIAEAPHACTYWQALAYGTAHTTAPLLATIANDVLPGRQWLLGGYAAYQNRFGGAPGLMGFNGDGHGWDHSCHLLIHRALLARFGGWPLHYRHNYGDTELCQRAHALGCYDKAPWAILYHDHPIAGGENDAIYDEGVASWRDDARRFHQRKGQGWTG